MRVNVKIMLQRRSFWFAFAVMLLLSIGTYLWNVFTYKGKCIDQVPAASSLYYLDVYNRYAAMIVYVALFLIVIPYANACLVDRKERTELAFLTKMTRTRWYASQAASAALGAALILLIPSLLNILLNGITFAENGNYTATTGQCQYCTRYFQDIDGSNVMVETLGKGILLRKLLYFSPQLYNMAYAFLFAFFGGMFALFSYTVSLFMGKLRIFVYIIPFAFVGLLEGLDGVCHSYSPAYVSTRLTEYVCTGFGKVGCSYLCFFCICVLLILISVYLVRRKGKKDEW